MNSDQTTKSDSDVARRFSKKGVFPHQLAFTLLIPLRNIFLSPKQLIHRLELSNDMKVMELGPGLGYFSKHVAKFLLKGHLVLADIQREMLSHAQKRLTKKGLKNVSYYLCDGKTFKFEENTFDRIYMVTVIGEVENKDTYMRHFYRILKKNGILSISEQAGDPDRMTPSEVIQLAEQGGFHYDKKFTKRGTYTINFRKL